MEHLYFVYHRLPGSSREMDGCPFAKDEASPLSKWRSNHHGAGNFLKNQMNPSSMDAYIALADTPWVLGGNVTDVP